MKKIILSSILSILVGLVTAQTAKIGGYYIGADYISPNAGAEFVFTNMSSPPGAATAVEWIVKNQDGSIYSQSPNNYSYLGEYNVVFSQPGTYTAIIKVNWGSSAQKSDSMQITVINRNISYPDTIPEWGGFSYGIYENCSPVIVSFKPELYPKKENLPDSLAIHTGDGDRITFVGDSFIYMFSTRHVYKQAGAYSPTYFFYKTIDIGGQKEIYKAQINETDSIYVIDLKPDFERIDPLQPSQPVTFINKSKWIPSYLPYDSVSWDFGNGNFSQDYNASIPYNSAGTYQVRLTMKVANCIRDNLTVGIYDIKDNYSPVTIYPNPVSTELHVNFDTQKSANYTIYNIMGQIILQGKLDYFSIINVEFLSAGMYYLDISGTKFKFVKM